MLKNIKQVEDISIYLDKIYCVTLTTSVPGHARTFLLLEKYFLLFIYCYYRNPPTIDFSRPNYKDYKMFYEPVKDRSIGIYCDVYIFFYYYLFTLIAIKLFN